MSLPIRMEVACLGGRGAVEGAGCFFWIALRTRAWLVEGLAEALGRGPVIWAFGPSFSPPPLPQNAIPLKLSIVGPGLCYGVFWGACEVVGLALILEAGQYPTLARMASLLLRVRARTAVSGDA